MTPGSAAEAALALKSIATSASTATAAIEVFQRKVMGEPPFAWTSVNGVSIDACN
jgi:hypothetical protein